MFLFVIKGAWLVKIMGTGILSDPGILPVMNVIKVMKGHG
jgi:hypothetical protein